MVFVSVWQGLVSKLAASRGIFGHLASSKEEVPFRRPIKTGVKVLKMRGPMSANEYEAVPGDDLDLRVQYFARPRISIQVVRESRQIPEHLGEWLKIYRSARGEYEAL